MTFYFSLCLPSLHKVGLGLALLTCAGLTASSAHAQNTLFVGRYNTPSSGTVHIDNFGTIASGTYQYYDETGSPSSLDPTRTNYNYLETFSSSTASVSGGSIGTIDAFEVSTANISGGKVNFFDALGASTANVTGGTINNFYMEGTSTANIGGGSIGLLTYGASIANISGGNITSLTTHSTSTTNISGGDIYSFSTYDTSTLNLYGTEFTETLLGKYYLYNFYSVTGTLQNGDTLNASYYDYGGKLVFNAPVPEASSVVSLGLLLLGLGGVAVSCRRKGQAAV